MSPLRRYGARYRAGRGRAQFDSREGRSMFKKFVSRWVWYAVLVAVIAGLFAPTMVAHAGKVPVGVPACLIPTL